MAYSVQDTVGDGVTDVFSLNFTLGNLRREYVTCRVGDEVDGGGDPVYRTLQWITDGMVRVLGPVPGNGERVLFQRTMPKDRLLHDFQDGEPLTEKTLDESNQQLLMAIQEVLDGRLESSLGNVLDMGMNRIINLAPGINPNDAVNMAQLGDAPIQAERAKNWAIKMDGPVEGGEYSAKYNANQSGVARIASEAARDSILNDAGFQAVSADLLGPDTIGTVATNISAVQNVDANMPAVLDAVHQAQAAEDARDDAEIARDFAHEWATQAEDVPVDDGVNPPGFSAFHWAEEAAETATQFSNNIVPVGACFWFPLGTAPAGYLQLGAGGEVDDVYPELKALLVNGNYPWGQAGNGNPLLLDAPDHFIRIWTGDVTGGFEIGDKREDQMQQITGTMTEIVGTDVTSGTGAITPIHTGQVAASGAPSFRRTYTASFDSANSNGARTGTETFPKHTYMGLYIKAYGAVSIEGMADLAELLTHIATIQEAIEGTSNSKFITPYNLKAALQATSGSIKLDEITGTSLSSMVLELDSNFDTYDIDWSLQHSVATGITILLSFDGGVTFPSPNTNARRIIHGVSSVTPATQDGGGLYYGPDISFNRVGRMTLINVLSGLKQAFAHETAYVNVPDLNGVMFSSRYDAGSYPNKATHIRISPVAGTLSGTVTVRGVN